MITRSRFITPYRRFYYIIFSVAIPLICALASLGLDVDPVEYPDADLADLITIRDAFSCNPRFKTHLENFIFVEGQMIFSAGLIFVVVVLIIREMLKVSLRFLVHQF
jgi:hypothetical protein